MNAKLSADGKVLTLELAVNSAPPISKTGKSRIVSTTNGFVPVGLTVNGKSVKVSVNVISEV